LEAVRVVGAIPDEDDMLGGTMTSHLPRQDVQDKQFGAAAAEDQKWVDELDDEGVEPEALPDEPSRQPRAGGKAEPQ
jgi:hypothetical protein